MAHLFSYNRIFLVTVLILIIIKDVVQPGKVKILLLIIMSVIIQYIASFLKSSILWNLF